MALSAEVEKFCEIQRLLIYTFTLTIFYNARDYVIFQRVFYPISKIQKI